MSEPEVVSEDPTTTAIKARWDALAESVAAITAAVPGTILEGVHSCPIPDLPIGRDLHITRPVVWRCDCGYIWELLSEPFRGVLGNDLGWKRTWCRVYGWDRVRYTIRSWFTRK